MTYEEFEWHVLRLVYEERMDQLRPAFLAYALGLPHGTVTEYLERAMSDGLVEMDVTSEGHIVYVIPGADLHQNLPKPVWKDELEPEPQSKTEPKEQPREAAAASQGGEAVSLAAADGSASADADSNAMVPYQGAADGTDGSIAFARGRRAIPSNLRRHIQARYATVDEPTEHDAVAARRRPRTIEEEAQAEVDAIVPYGASKETGLLRVESSEEAFCDPSRTMFMRQIRIYGSQSPTVIREQVARLFHSFGYRVIHSEKDRMRFERGSVMFILALVPLFVLVLPLFLYLFLYTMGRSTIQQEPLELDVQFRHKDEKEPYWEIDLTFVGLHGVVLGAADQQVLNREIDTLREELRWALQAAS
jgi:hypothetical protein